MNSTNLRLTALFVIAVAISTHLAPAAQAPAASPAPDYNAFYQIGPDSLPHDGVPKGEVRGPFVLPSQAYPGTQHTYWIYVPAVRPGDRREPDDFSGRTGVQGHGRRRTRAERPRQPHLSTRDPGDDRRLQQPGRTPEQPEPTPADWGDWTTNRPAEYNTLDDKYARVIVDELMPVL